MDKLKEVYIQAMDNNFELLKQNDKLHHILHEVLELTESPKFKEIHNYIRKELNK